MRIVGKQLGECDDPSVFERGVMERKTLEKAVDVAAIQVNETIGERILHSWRLLLRRKAGVFVVSSWSSGAFKLEEGWVKGAEPDDDECSYETQHATSV